MRLLNSGSAMLDRYNAAQGETVTVYVDGTSVDVTAVISAPMAGFDLGSGGQVRSWRPTDFLIAREDLVLNGVEFEPRPGMRIERTVRGQVVPFEVRPDDDGRCFDNSDSVTRAMLRIHAKEIYGTEDE